MNKEHWISVVLVCGVILIILGAASDLFLGFAGSYPIVASFMKFFVLASIGDVIGLKLQTKKWTIPVKFFYKAIVWGLIGVVIYLMFQIYPTGVVYLQKQKVLPFEGIEIATAFFISLIMNYTFAPTMMAVHRISDTYLNERARGSIRTFQGTINTIDWGRFYTFTLFRTIPLFWVPAHTITFLLPPEYRVLFAAILGIVLGILLSFTNRVKK
jgi:hypothetical protein